VLAVVNDVSGQSQKLGISGGGDSPIVLGGAFRHDNATSHPYSHP